MLVSGPQVGAGVGVAGPGVGVGVQPGVNANVKPTVGAGATVGTQVRQLTPVLSDPLYLQYLPRRALVCPGMPRGVHVVCADSCSLVLM
jgi:hypothetical protein